MLILKADRDALLKPLMAVVGIVDRRHTIPIMANVLIEKIGNRLSFLASDMEIQITSLSHGSIEGDEDFKITVNAKKLTDILKACSESAQISWLWEDSRLTVKAGKSRFNLQTLSADTFPEFKIEDELQSEILIPQNKLKHLLSQVQYAMAVQDIRYYLNGLLLQVQNNELRVISTDGHRLAYASCELEKSTETKEVILPRKTIIELSKLLQEGNENLISIKLMTNQAHFTFEQANIMSKVVEGKFPDYNRVIPLDNDKIFLVNRVLFLQSLQRVSILANEKFRGVTLTISSGKISIQCANNDHEEAQEEIEIDYSGDAIETHFNISYLMDVLTNLNCEEIQLAFGMVGRSALLTIPGSTDFKYIAMPMRV